MEQAEPASGAPRPTVSEPQVHFNSPNYRRSRGGPRGGQSCGSLPTSPLPAQWLLPGAEGTGVHRQSGLREHTLGKRRRVRSCAWLRAPRQMRGAEETVVPPTCLSFHDYHFVLWGLHLWGP